MGRGKIWTKIESEEAEGRAGVGLRGRREGLTGPDRCLQGCGESVSRAGVHTGSFITWVAEKIEKDILQASV